MRKFLMKIMAVMMLILPMVMVVPVWADDDTGNNNCGVDTNLIHCSGNDLNEGGAIMEILMNVVNILSGIILVAATVGIIVAGVQYATARDNDGQVVKAKSRLLQIVIGLAAYALMWAFLNWLVPGGLFSIN